MKRIRLYKAKYVDGIRIIVIDTRRTAIVDDEDFDRLSKYRWHVMPKVGRGYACRSRRIAPGETRPIYMHHEIIGRIKGRECDHINGNPLDNRRANLRSATRSQNNQNKKYKNNTSGFKGVSWREREKRWEARITIHRKTYHLGEFTTAFAAAKVYDVAAQLFYGQHAMLNFKN